MINGAATRSSTGLGTTSSASRSRLVTVLSLLVTARAVPAASSTDWTNGATAIGTLALAALTFVTLAFTVVATTLERRQAARDRVAAEKRLEDERAAGEQRVRDERAHADEVRRRDRQVANVSVLVARVAELQAFMTGVPGSALRAGWARPSMSAHSRSMADEEALHAISSLRHGAWTEAAMLGTGEAAEAAADRCRTLVRLVDEAARLHPFPDRDLDTLRNYARWVLISLRTLAEDETVPPIYGGSPERPLLGLAEHMPAWLPNPIPAGWNDIAEADPPVHRSAHLNVGTGGVPAEQPSG